MFVPLALAALVVTAVVLSRRPPASPGTTPATPPGPAPVPAAPPPAVADRFRGVPGFSEEEYLGLVLGCRTAPCSAAQLDRLRAFYRVFVQQGYTTEAERTRAIVVQLTGREP